MKLEKLTAEQEQKMFDIKQYWLDYIFSCQNSVNREDSKKKIEWLYNLAGISSPIVIYLDSPLACQYGANYLKFLLGDRAQVGAQVWDQVRDQVGDQVWAQVRDQVRAQVWDQELKWFDFCNYGCISDYGWISFFDFFTQIGVVNNQKFNEIKSILESGIYDMIQLNGVCIVCDMPTEIKRNENNRLHSVEYPAIKFKDSYEQYFINGRSITKKYFEAIKNKTYTIKDFFSEKNEEVKSVCLQMMIELYGDNYLATFFESILKEVNTYVDKKPEKFLQGTTGGMNIGVYTLFEGELDGYKVAYVRCYCPSTDRMFYLGVAPGFKTAKDAIASLYTIPKELKPFIKSIRRQGERFSTTFQKEGLEIIRAKKSHGELVSISGEEYFKKLEYEY